MATLIKNLSKTALNHAYIVARRVDGENWYWGAYDTCREANETAYKIHGLVFPKEIIEMSFMSIEEIDRRMDQLETLMGYEKMADCMNWTKYDEYSSEYANLKQMRLRKIERGEG